MSDKPQAKSMTVGDLTPWHIGTNIAVADGETWVTGPLRGVASVTEYVEDTEMGSAEPKRTPTKTTISLKVGSWGIEDISAKTVVTMLDT